MCKPTPVGHLPKTDHVRRCNNYESGQSSTVTFWQNQTGEVFNVGSCSCVVTTRPHVAVGLSAKPALMNPTRVALLGGGQKKHAATKAHCLICWTLKPRHLKEGVQQQLRACLLRS